MRAAARLMALPFAALFAAALSAPASGAATPGGSVVAKLDQAEKDLKAVEERLVLVENAYAYKAEPPEAEQLRKRYSDAEIQFLLGNYQPASVLLYDLISNAVFKRLPEYAEALYLLGESLYQEQNFLGSRMYFREHMSAGGSHYKESLARYLDISGRVNEFSGVEQFLARAKDAAGGISADLAYPYAKWTYRRADVAKDKRLPVARDTFAQIAALGGTNALQAQYYVGVIAVDQGDLNAAAQAFEKIVKATARNAVEKKIHELANLSLGRVFYELGRHTEALDRYQEVDRDSEYFVEALYEIAWTYVKKGDFDKANRACEILLLVAPDSTVAPEARILQGHLLLKLQKFGEASETYNEVINQYAPVRDEIDALLSVHADPVKYFDDLLARNERNFDVTSLLPPVAVKWATTQREVSEAVRLVGDLNQAKVGVNDSRELASRLLSTLDKRGMEAFPSLHEGFARAELADSQLSSVEQALVEVEGGLPGSGLGGAKAELEALRKEWAEIEAKFQQLPKSESDLEERKKRMAQRLDGIQKEHFKLGLVLDSYMAMLAAMEKWANDTRAEHDAGETREYLESIRQRRELVTGLRAEQEQLGRAIRDEVARLGFGGGDEPKIRERYQQTLDRERDLLARMRSSLPAEAQVPAARIDSLREQIAQLRVRSEKAKGVIRDAIRRKGEAIRQKVRAEEQLLDGYDREVQLVAGDARNLVGRITYSSFKRVRREFYDLVLKADVGLVDVAWQRKQDKTNKIQDLAKQKDRELKALDADFKEALKDVE